MCIYFDVSTAYVANLKTYMAKVIEEDENSHKHNQDIFYSESEERRRSEILRWCEREGDRQTCKHAYLRNHWFLWFQPVFDQSMFWLRFTNYTSFCQNIHASVDIGGFSEICHEPLDYWWFGGHGYIPLWKHEKIHTVKLTKTEKREEKDERSDEQRVIRWWRMLFLLCWIVTTWTSETRVFVCCFDYPCSSSSLFVTSSTHSTERERESKEKGYPFELEAKYRLQAFWKDQERHRLASSIDLRFMGCNDQRLFDQTAIDAVVTPQDAKLLSVHAVAYPRLFEH